ncbi:MAG: metallophosphoesterase, partial [Deltaproteobacteria bacterium]|nr:metallophosphoesterase [Deltaproteobacteria bacterium]
MARTLQFGLFLLVTLTIVGSIHGYFWLRLVRDPAWPAPWRQGGGLLLLGLALCMPLAAVVGRLLPFAITRWVVLLPFVWMGTMLLLLVFVAGADLLRLAAWGVQLARGSELTDSVRLLSSRWLAATALLGAVALTLVGIRSALQEPVVRHVEVQLERLPRALDGFTIVQLSDLHLGLTLGGEWLGRTVELSNGLHPDLVAITGDLVDGSVVRLRQEVAALARLRARHGVFFVTGNHEIYSGLEDWLMELQRLGLRVLRNERVRIGTAEAGFALAGIDDGSTRGQPPGHGADLTRALAGRDPQQEVVLLAHQPKAVVEAARQGVGLVLAGHTHGGQLWPWNHFVPLQQPYVAGLHRH